MKTSHFRRPRGRIAQQCSALRAYLRPRALWAALAVFLAGPSPVLAHHVIDNRLPQGFAEGLLSGLGHPIIGPDHLAMLVAIGVCAGLARHPFFLAAAFIAATLAGVGLHLRSFDLPFVEQLIVLGILLVGGLMMAGRVLSAPVSAALFAVLGICHGYAYGESIVGAWATPLAAYMTGLAAIQFAVIAGIAWTMCHVQRLAHPGDGLTGQDSDAQAGTAQAGDDAARMAAPDIAAGLRNQTGVRLCGAVILGVALMLGAGFILPA